MRPRSCCGFLKTPWTRVPAGSPWASSTNPGLFASPDEIKEVALLVKKKGKILSVHLRALSALAPGYPLRPSASRTMSLPCARCWTSPAHRVRLQISHLIFVGSRTWRTADTVPGAHRQGHRRRRRRAVRRLPLSLRGVGDQRHAVPLVHRQGSRCLRGCRVASPAEKGDPAGGTAARVRAVGHPGDRYAGQRPRGLQRQVPARDRPGAEDEPRGGPDGYLAAEAAAARGCSATGTATTGSSKR